MDLESLRARLRGQFPALQSDFAYLENAGGSQVPGVVADAVRDHMLRDYVQLGAGYPASDRATETVAAAHAFADELANAPGIGKVVLGGSATVLTTLLADAYSRTIKPGDEVVVAQSNHEANAGSWHRLERVGAVVKSWSVNPQTFALESLEPLLSDRTKIVAFPHVSNLLGQVEDVASLVKTAKRVGARTVVDGVAYAPHRAIDTKAWGVDWYVWSVYKVYGPHMGAMFGTYEAFDELDGPGHFFFPKNSITSKWELGGASHEACAGLAALRSYLALAAEQEAYQGRQTVEDAFSRFDTLESGPANRLVDGLRSKGCTLIGSHPEADRVGTVSFVVPSEKPVETVARLQAASVGVRSGHMYALRLARELGLDEIQGIVRASLLHYNTHREVDRLLAAL